MVKINEKYYLDADSRNYTLKEKTKIKDKEGNEKDGFKDIGYYTSLDSLFNGLMKLETRKFIARDEEADIKALISKIDEIESFFKSKLGEV